MTIPEALYIATAIVTSLGGGALLVLALSSWLGRLWAERILAAEKNQLEKSLTEYQGKIDRAVHRTNIASSRIDSQRTDAIRQLYAALVSWHEVASTIAAPNDFASNAQGIEYVYLARYFNWAKDLRRRSEKLEDCAMRTAIYFEEGTYQLIVRCGYAASEMSIDFYGATNQDVEPGTANHLIRVEAARSVLQTRYQTDYQSARAAVVSAFRQIIDPPDVTN